MTSLQSDPVKQQVAAHWGRRAAHFDEDFGHSIRTAAERAAWDRIFDLVLGGRSGLDALDAGCGTGFLSLELASRGHRVTGVDFAPAMLAEARRKAAQPASRRLTPSSCRLRPAASTSSSADMCCGPYLIRRRRWTSGFAYCGQADGSPS